MVSRMHVDQLEVDEPLVRRLLGRQFPAWASLPLQQVRAGGTVNAVFRLGDELAVRLPLRVADVEGLDRQARFLPRVAAAVRARVPTVLAVGAPDAGYPCRWAVLDWLPGAPPQPGQVLGGPFVDDLARFLADVHALPVTDLPVAYRRALPPLDGGLRAALDRLGARVDRPAALEIWLAAMQAGADPPPRAAIHCDVLPANVLISGGRLTGAIDWEAFGLGDPAVDLMIAWHVLDVVGRERLRTLLEVDEPTWRRARGWALYQAVVALDYYQLTNPTMAAYSAVALGRLTADA
jgi:aminoglycoside phosphotransferase (APT) family kinase protein